jgi:transmembrane sensor
MGERSGASAGGQVNHDEHRHSHNVELTRRAADWFVRISSNTLSEHELAQWLNWMSVEENAAEFQRIIAVSHGVETLRPALAGQLDEALAEPRLLRDTPASDHRETPDSPQAGSGRRSSWKVRPAFAAALVGLCVLVGWYGVRSARLFNRHRIEAPQAVTHSTWLPDGSKMIVAPRSILAHDFSGAARVLELSRGEVFFKVRTDRSRPFIVRVGGISAMAVGTAFDVSAEADHIVVTVEEGTVDVAGAKAAPGRWRLTAGFRATFSATGDSVQVSNVVAATALAWRDGQLDYYNQPLRVVAADVTRYSSHTIELADSTVGDLKFTGTVFTAEVDDWLEALQSTFPVRVTRQATDHVVLSALATGAAPALDH